MIDTSHVIGRIRSGEVITASDLMAVMVERLQMLDTADAEYRAASIEAATAKDAYRQAKAKAYGEIVKHEMGRTVDERRALMDIGCADTRARAYVSEARAKSALETLRTYRDQLSAIQSMRRMIEAEGAASGNGGYGV